LTRRARRRGEPPRLDGRVFAWRSLGGGLTGPELHGPPLGLASAFTVCGLRLAGLAEVRVEPAALERGLAWCTECWSVPPQAGDAVQSTVVVPREDA